MTERGMKVSFAEDLAPGTLIRHAVVRSATLQARAMQDARAMLEQRQGTCTIDTGDGDEWDDGDDVTTVTVIPVPATSSAPAAASGTPAPTASTSDSPLNSTRETGIEKRISAADAYSLPDYEFIDDFIAYKMK